MRIIKFLLLGALSVILLLILSVILAVTTSTGTKYTLSLVEHFSGIRIQGVSGSLIRQFNIQHVELHHKDIDLVMDDVALQWQPKALFDRQIQLDFIRANSVQLASVPGNGAPVTLPTSLKLPQFIRRVKLDQFTVNNAQLSSLEANRTHNKPQQFSALKAQVSIDSNVIQSRFSGVTPWGSATLEGNVKSEAPFNTQAQFSWQGLAIEQNDIHLPGMQIVGTVSGNLTKLLVEAKLNALNALNALNTLNEHNAMLTKHQQSMPLKKPTIEPANGHFHAVLTPFDILPVETLQVSLVSVNPATFYREAPKANLLINADFNVIGDAQSPNLHGHFSLKNTTPTAWNLGGIPISSLNSDVTVTKNQISWQATKMEFMDGGSVTGLVTSSGQLNLREYKNISNDVTTSAHLPEITTSLELKNVNLLRIDNRLQKTNLTGKVQVESVKTGLQFGMNLHDDQQNLNAALAADVQLSHALVLSLKKIELVDNEAKLTVQGSFALRGRQEFLLQGDAHNINPARWLNVPEGRIATHFNVAGQLKQGWRVDAQVAHLTGQFAGLDLQGESSFFAQQDKLLSIKNLELNWGNNHLSAKGNWQTGGTVSTNQQDKLQINLAVPDLAALSRPFNKILPLELNGAIFADGVLSGSMSQPSGQLKVKANKLAIPGVVTLDKLQSTFDLEEGIRGKVDGNLDLTGLMVGASIASQLSEDQKGAKGFKINHLQANLAGLRHAHKLQLTANLPHKYQVDLQVQGNLQDAGVVRNNENKIQWLGQVQKLNLSGGLDLQLMSPFALQMVGQSVQMGLADWQGKLGKLQVQQINWSPGQLKTSGKWQGLPVISAVKLWRSDAPLLGDLQIDAAWQLEMGQQTIGQQLKGKFEIKRTSGDVVVQDITNGYSQSFSFGLQKLSINGHFGEVEIAQATASRQPVSMQLFAQGDRLGQIEINFNSFVNKTEQSWTMVANAPISGMANMQINDIQWMNQLVDFGVALQGELKGQAQITGTLEKPDYSAKISGKNLQVSFTDLGVILPHGVLEASVEDSQFRLNKLAFSQTIKSPPKHAKLTELTWLNDTGYVESSGVINWQTGQSSITARWQHFPFLQNTDNWLVASGEAQLSELTEPRKMWNLTGQLIADAAYFSVPKQAPPKLSSDIIVLKKNDRRHIENENENDSNGFQSNVDFSISTGKKFVFVGRGLNTSLDGDLRIRIQNNGPILATGSIQTIGGTYEGYGQQLTIERGILNFQGALDNPGLNVRAMRRGLPVEAGVDVVGTVAKPEVRLVSEPNVPDQDKLSWLVLGRSSDQIAGSEAGLLMSAASAIVGGDSSIQGDIAHTFGLDTISVGTVSATPNSQLPSQTVAGNIGNTAQNDQVFSVEKRITPGLIFSIERSLTDATNGVRLTWQLTRHFSVIGRAGSDTSIDGQYTFSFN